MALLPPETDSVLLIDPDAMLTLPVASQPLQPIAWWDTQLRKILHAVQLIQFAPNHRPEHLWASTPRPAAVETEKQVFRGLISE
jgi:hypothetical protein